MDYGVHNMDTMNEEGLQKMASGYAKLSDEEKEKFLKKIREKLKIYQKWSFNRKLYI